MSPAKIEETRREPRQFAPTVAPPRGVLQSVGERGSAFVHQRLAPASTLASFIQNFWYVQWDLRGKAPGTAETLPHPNCYLVFEHDLERPIDDPGVHRRAEVSGVASGKFSRTLDGHGRVFGLKFQPGGLRPFLRTSASTLTDRVVSAAEIFGPGILVLATQLRTLDSPGSMVETASAYFAEHLPARDPNTENATRIVEMILHDATIRSVESAAKRSGISVRSLQRLFGEYVGVSPKWVIRRFRLHELLERFNLGNATDGAQIALDLGYADQAHLINDFRKLVGYSPTGYLRRAGRS